MIINRIREARVRQGFSQQDLANRIGVSRQTVNLIEGGKYNPSLKICKGMCSALNSNLNDIFGD